MWFHVGRDKVIYGDDVGRDKIVNQGQLIIQQALSAIDEAEKARVLESARLAERVRDCVRQLLAVSTPGVDRCEGGPYRGLLAYELSDAEIFFGRDKAIAAVGEHLQRSKLAVIQSESGAGKTSLLKAGVAPRLLSAGHLPLILRPYNRSPTVSIAQAFVPDARQAPGLAGAPLRVLLSQVGAVLGPERILFIILDQFEEFFNLLPEPKTRHAFMNDLAECCEDPSLNVRRVPMDCMIWRVTWRSGRRVWAALLKIGPTMPIRTTQTMAVKAQRPLFLCLAFTALARGQFGHSESTVLVGDESILSCSTPKLVSVSSCRSVEPSSSRDCLLMKVLCLKQ